MTSYPALEAAAETALVQLGPGPLCALADRLAAANPDHTVLQAVPVPGFADTAAALLSALRSDGVSGELAAAYLRGLAAGHSRQAAAVRIESVWSGPSTHHVPVRATAQVLVDVIGEAKQELVLMTYSAKPYAPLLDALSAAIARGVTVTVIVETLAGAGSALGGAEPASAFISVPKVELWHWPKGRRTEDGAKMHAKLAIADRKILLVSSANMTQAGVSKNIEAGVLVRGGTAPQRAAEHIAELKSTGVLIPLAVGDWSPARETGA